MKNLIFLFALLNATFLYGQNHNNATMVINDGRDVISTVASQEIHFYIKGITSNEINAFIKDVKQTKGVSYCSLKVTDEKLKMTMGKIKYTNDCDKKHLIEVLEKYRINKIVISGQPETPEDFFYEKENGHVIMN